MTDEQTDLARQLVRAPWWRWMPGMLVTRQRGVLGEWQLRRLSRWVERQDGRHSDDDEDEYHREVWQGIGYTYDGGASGLTVYVNDQTSLPDLTDPATAGCLLALLVEQGEHWVQTVAAAPPMTGVTVGFGRRGQLTSIICEGACLGEAVARCLLALEVPDDAP